MTDLSPRNGPTLREYFEGLFAAHKELHDDHAQAHGREHAFAGTAIETAAKLAQQVKDDFGERVSVLENAEIRRAENERIRLAAEAEEKRQTERRQARAQWQVGIAATTAAILVSIAIRLLTP